MKRAQVRTLMLFTKTPPCHSNLQIVLIQRMRGVLVIFTLLGVFPKSCPIFKWRRSYRFVVVRCHSFSPLSLGVDTIGNLMNIVIPRNTPIQTKEAQVYSTTKDNQTFINIKVKEQDLQITISWGSLEFLEYRALLKESRLRYYRPVTKKLVITNANGRD
ncbi:putative Heat shock protein 70 family [Helianthus annuus]|nr:putative Heat shock protein 70 family [Helianthus annuus]